MLLLRPRSKPEFVFWPSQENLGGIKPSQQPTLVCIEEIRASCAPNFFPFSKSAGTYRSSLSNNRRLTLNTKPSDPIWSPWVRVIRQEPDPNQRTFPRWGAGHQLRRCFRHVSSGQCLRTTSVAIREKRLKTSDLLVGHLNRIF